MSAGCRSDQGCGCWEMEQRGNSAWATALCLWEGEVGGMHVVGNVVWVCTPM